MAIGGGMSCVKYLLFCFNLLFAITGLIILIVGLKAQYSAHPYMDMTDETFFTSAPMVLVVIGVIVFIVAFFGCCGAVKENHCMIITFSVLLLVIFVAELAVGIAGYVKRDDLSTSVERYINEKMPMYGNDTEITRTFDILQTDLKCCGLKGPVDWVTLKKPIPPSCCTELLGDGKTCTMDDPNIHSSGCLNAIVSFLKGTAFSLGGVGLGIAIVQLLGVMFACCLARSIRSQYETV